MQFCSVSQAGQLVRVKEKFKFYSDIPEIQHYIIHPNEVYICTKLNYLLTVYKV